ncbi:MAG TPA: ribosome-associated translation inhibitor RaiA [Gammaproteobacteria bacterium]|jgi:putative sigma-54 modulation protein|nr:ribosomal subunit interface protein [Acidiferrobacteraceae bacterium]MDP6551357.1 ribosome-associated translation inhibitor RaiA [Arenicellales bacterium]MDP6792179.1 ribosome-associated translation inhibitor RaiA [Arenicellales bacterium]MDP6919933.1 ribosome-associated translation inhibitor RaiA [Arenicellales bacterium]HCX87696.1 ribosome-associated translation inhibitor RaiA [Gammaproteobacteria bacterium]|tara:strand:+ start:3131 stop:3460 length:330 start_codon:yes stop_codon:yes gene_type:complete
MDVIVTGQHLEISDTLRDHVNQKISRVTRHYDHVTSAHVVLHVEKTEHLAEVTVHIPGHRIHAAGHATDMYAAIDAMTDKLDRQITRHKERIADHHQSDGGIKTLSEKS